MVTIIFESHSTTLDNEAHLSSGHFDVDLSELGLKQSKELGERYKDTAKRMKLFLADLMKNYNDKKVMIIGHRATQYGLEHWIKGVSVSEAVTASWKWQPGWTYLLENI